MHSHHNGLKTAALLGLLTAMILAVGYWLGGSGGLVFAVVLSLAINAGSYFFSDKIALRSMGARPVSEAEFPALYQIVRELSTEAGQPMPRLYVSPTQQPNAFATGRNPKNAAVAVTVGITQILDRRELRGVIGHELSHVYNRDILISSVAAALAGIITMFAQLAIFLPLGGGDDDDGPNPASLLLMLILGPLAASVIQLAISRNREFQADASGATLTRAVVRRGTVLADELVKIPNLMVVSQFGIMAFELLSPLVFFLPRKWRLRAIAGFYAFHVMVMATITISFLPHLAAMTSFLELERVRPIYWLRGRMAQAAVPPGSRWRLRATQR